MADLRRWVQHASYVRKWLVLGVAIGVIAGLGAIVFYAALQLASKLLLGDLAGYRAPAAIGDGGPLTSHGPAHWWLLPLVVGGGALLASVLVHLVSPEAGGHGTDAAIDAIHHNPRAIRLRTVVVKLIASALTIGAGGSAGREGPTGQISGGFGSLLARVLDLDDADAGIAVATGVGSGIGAIFGAPLGGAMLSAEILYRDDIDPRALLPSFIASGVGYAIFGSVEGFTPLFGYQNGFHFSDPSQLLWFALVGIICGFVGLLYAKSFYAVHDTVGRLPWPKWLTPALGGLLVGVIAIAVPQVLGTGYGWIQRGMGASLDSIPLWIVLVLPFARIIATSLSIGTGGSGGVFAPGMVIGAFIGAAVWRLVHPLTGIIGPDPEPYVIVGMMCCFGSISRAPLAMILMVCGMTGGFSAIEPAIVAVGLAWLIVHRADATMYRSQLRNRREHAHAASQPRAAHGEHQRRAPHGPQPRPQRGAGAPAAAYSGDPGP
jgi:chloride channel protein, CIC family